MSSLSGGSLMSRGGLALRVLVAGALLGVGGASVLAQQTPAYTPLGPSFMGSSSQSYLRGVTANGLLWGTMETTNQGPRALVWTSPNASSAIDLTPAFLGSNRYAFAGGVTSDGAFWGAGAGGATGNREHALLWTSASASSALDLNPTVLGTNATSTLDAIMTSGLLLGKGRSNQTNNLYHALIWTSATASSAVDMTPAFLGTNAESFITEMSPDGTFRGTGSGSATNNVQRALVWTSTNPNSAIDLTPTALGSDRFSQVKGRTSGGIYWGEAGSHPSHTPGGYDHAAIWTSASAESMVDLHPAFLGEGFSSFLSGTADGHYWGASQDHSNSATHALFWNSASAESAMDLHPSFLGANSQSSLWGRTSDGKLWGTGYGTATGNEFHSLVWLSPDADSAVDITPTFLGDHVGSSIYGVTNDGVFWGSAYRDITTGPIKVRGIVWTSASADSAIDLTNFTLGSDTSSVGGYDETGKYFYGSAGGQAAIWKLANNEPNGNNALSISDGATSYLIGSGFTQTGGFTHLGNNASLVLTDGNAGNGFETFTLAGGTLSGKGSLTGDLVNTGGTISPGNSPGTLTINGDYTQTGTGTLLVELNGASPGQWDVLNVTGTATLGGVLTLSLGPGYVPAVGSGFDFLVALTGLDGTFDMVNVLGLGPGIGYEIQYLTPGQIGASGTMNGYRTLVVFVPEPGTFALLLPALGIGYVVLARRRS